MSEELDLTALKSYLEGRDEIVAAYLFGSRARGEAGARSEAFEAIALAWMEEREAQQKGDDQ